MQMQLQQQQQQQPQIQTKVTQVSGQKDINPIIAGTRSATRIANNPANNSIPTLRNILPKNAVVSEEMSTFFSPFHSVDLISFIFLVFY